MATTTRRLDDGNLQPSGNGQSFNTGMYARYPGTRRPAATVQPQGSTLPSQILKALGLSPQAAQQLNSSVLADKYSQQAGFAPAGQGYRASASAVDSGAGGVAPTDVHQQGGGVMGGGNFTTSTVNPPPNNGTPENGSDPVDWTFGAGGPSYSQRDLESMLNDPYDFQQEFLSSIGQNTPSANTALGQFASRVNPLAFLDAGANMNPEGQSDLEDLAGVYERLFQNYITPGARMPDVQEGLRTILQSGAIENNGTPESLLQSVLSGQDQPGQVQAINQIMGAMLAGMPGLFGTGWSNMLDQSGNSFMKGTKDAYGGLDNTYIDYLAADPFYSRLAGLPQQQG